MSARRRLVRLAVTALAVLGTWGVAAGRAEAQIIGYIGEPAANGTVGQPLTISGWVVSPGAPSGTGVNAVHIYRCPASNCGTKTFWGAATHGLERPDVAAAFRARYLYFGYSNPASGLPAGEHLFLRMPTVRPTGGSWRRPRATWT